MQVTSWCLASSGSGSWNAPGKSLQGSLAFKEEFFDFVEGVVDVARWYLSGFDGGGLGVRGLGAGFDGFGFV